MSQYVKLDTMTAGAGGGDASEATLSSIDTKVATEATLAAASAKLPASLGSTTSAASLSVVLSSDHGALPLPTGAATAAKQDTAQTTLAAIETAAEAVQAAVEGTLAVSAASLPLPTGAATSAAQTTGNTALAAIQAAVEGTLSVDDAGGSLTVDGTVAASNFPATVDTASGAAGASTLRAVLATRHESASTPISVRVSDGSAFSTPSPKGRSFADSVRNAYASTSVTTGAWVQLIASTAADINALLLFDSSGQTLELGTGAAASETRKLIIPPGGFAGPVPLYIAAGTRVSVRAVSGTASSGELVVTGLN